MYALVTGASSGIGQEMALLLAKRGYDLIIVARRTDRLEALKEKLCKKYKSTVLIMECDLSKEESVYQLFDSVKEYPIQVLINNAGFGKMGEFDIIPLKEELDMVRTNVLSLHILTKLFVTWYSEGYILNVASMAGFQPSPLMAAYGATKAYVWNLSMAINYELKRDKKNIHITTLCPGPVDTEFNQVANADFHLSSMSAKRCAEEAIRGMFAKRDLIVPGKRMNALRILTKFSPYQTILPVEYWIQSKKRKG